MKALVKAGKWVLGIVIVLYVAVCAFFYTQQQSILFLPKKLSADFKFNFEGNYTLRDVRTKDGTVLSGVLFKADSARGLIFYVHGNAGALDTWSSIADFYTSLGYDIYIFDYRGYGKSGGEIASEAQLYEDVQAAYDDLKTTYAEDQITVLGYSIGTAPAAMLAAINHPHLLLLQAPYYSMVDMMQHTYPFLPTFMLRYPLRTADFVAKAQSRVSIIHGTADEVLYYGSSLKLRQHFHPGDTLITLQGQGHNGFTKNPEYLAALGYLLK
jgi:uncharacterized protein